MTLYFLKKFCTKVNFWFNLSKNFLKCLFQFFPLVHTRSLGSFPLRPFSGHKSLYLAGNFTSVLDCCFGVELPSQGFIARKVPFFSPPPLFLSYPWVTLLICQRAKQLVKVLEMRAWVWIYPSQNESTISKVRVKITYSIWL